MEQPVFSDQDDTDAFTRGVRESGILQARRPWQEELVKMVQVPPDNGSVHIVVGENVGKTILVKYMEHMGLGCLIPPVSSPSDIMGWVMARGVSNCYIFDYPYATQKMRSSFWETIGSLKAGHVYTKKKGKLKERHFPPPVVILFFGPRTVGLHVQDNKRDCHYLRVDDKDMTLGSYYHSQIGWNSSKRQWDRVAFVCGPQMSVKPKAVIPAAGTTPTL